MEILKVDKLCKTYGTGDARVEALKAVSLTLEKGEFAAVVGESGSGKSTLLNLVGGLDTPNAGKVFLDGKDLFAMKEKELTVFRRRNIGFIFQGFHLIPELTVEQNLVFPVLLDYKKPDMDYVEELLGSLGLKERRKHLPSQLSGGQQQRVAIARALVSSDAVIVMDEPITNLDAKLREEMLIEIRQIQKNIGTTIFYITHDQEASLQLCDKMAIMDQNGELCQLGADEDIILRPSNRFVFEFIGVSNFFTLSRLGGDWCFAGNRNLVFDGTVPAQFDKAGTVDMGVRPNNITFDPASPVKAKVKRSVFLGSEYDYFVEFDGREVRVQKNAFDALQTGAVEQEGDTVGLKFVGPEFYPTAGKEEAV